VTAPVTFACILQPRTLPSYTFAFFTREPQGGPEPRSFSASSGTPRSNAEARSLRLSEGGAVRCATNHRALKPVHPPGAPEKPVGLTFAPYQLATCRYAEPPTQPRLAFHNSANGQVACQIAADLSPRFAKALSLRFCSSPCASRDEPRERDGRIILRRGDQRIADVPTMRFTARKTSVLESRRTTAVWVSASPRSPFR